MNYKYNGGLIFKKVVFFSKVNSKYLFTNNNISILFFLGIKEFILVWTYLGLMLLKDVIKKKIKGFLFCKFI